MKTKKPKQKAKNKTPKPPKIRKFENIRTWLGQNGYHEVLALIDETEARWKRRGVKTRRNWWEVLAGKKDGSPCLIDGSEFPVLEAAQRRQKISVTNSAIRNKAETSKPPSKWVTGRWPDEA